MNLSGCIFGPKINSVRKQSTLVSTFKVHLLLTIILSTSQPNPNQMWSSDMRSPYQFHWLLS